MWDAEFFAAYSVEPDRRASTTTGRLWQAEDGTPDDASR